MLIWQSTADGVVIDAVEKNVRAAHEAADVAAMTSAILEGYGGEIYGFLVTAHGSTSVADDVFADFSERLWRSLEGFELACSARTWAYRVARGASVDQHRRDARRAEVPLSDASRLSALVVRIRTETASHLKTERKTQIQQLRDELDPESRMLLVLRVDRGMAWRDLARVFLEERSAVFDDGALDREAARLRQRFQKMKRRLRALADARGISSTEAE